MAQQDNAPNKPVHLMYLIGAVILFYLLQWTIDWIWGYFGTAPSEFQISMMALAGATIVVIVMAIISALILGVFDAVWSKLTELVYGG